MIIMTLRLTVSPQKVIDVIELAKSIKGPLSADPECVGVDLFSDATRDDALTLVEKWESEEAIERYVKSAEFAKILAIMEMATSTPDITFDTVSDTAGLEFIGRLRR